MAMSLDQVLQMGGGGGAAASGAPTTTAGSRPPGGRATEVILPEPGGDERGGGFLPTATPPSFVPGGGGAPVGAAASSASASGVETAAAGLLHAWKALAAAGSDQQPQPEWPYDRRYDHFLKAPAGPPTMEAFHEVAEELPPAKYAALVASLRPEQREQLQVAALTLSGALHGVAAAATPAVRALRMLLGGYLPATANFPEDVAMGTAGALRQDFGQLEALAQLIRPDAAIPAVQSLRRELAATQSRVKGAGAGGSNTTTVALAIVCAVVGVAMLVFLGLWLKGRSKKLAGGFAGGATSGGRAYVAASPADSLFSRTVSGGR